jgi:Glucose/sorbosone dehydrogenases
MKKIFILFFFLISFNLYAQEIKLKKIVDSLDKPWSLSFIDKNNLIITEKSGKLYSLNLKNKKVSEIKHNLSILEVGQGGLLDVLYHNEEIYISYSENRGDWKTSTSVAKGKFDSSNIQFKNIFQANPPIDSGYHFGSRLVIKDKHLYITAGERGKGMIAQDVEKHPGSIIRINLDGSIPKDNPKFKNRNKWLPEIFQIGVRNPQGMALSPFDNKIYMTNHGARGGDWFGTVNYGENYGWKILGWGGTNYSGSKIGPKWKPGFTKAIKYWVPSIAVSAMTIYNGGSI